MLISNLAIILLHYIHTRPVRITHYALHIFYIIYKNLFAYINIRSVRFTLYIYKFLLYKIININFYYKKQVDNLALKNLTT